MKSCEFNISKKKAWKKLFQNPFILNPENLQTGSNQNSKHLIWQDSGGERFVWKNYVRMKLK